MRTGDLLLFRGTVRGTGFISWLICLVSGRFSHVGIAVYSGDFTAKFQIKYKLHSNTWYIFESTSISRVRDVFGNWVSGVQLSHLQCKVDSYRGKVWHRGLDKPPTKKNIALLEDIIDAFYGVPYEKNKAQLALAALDFTRLQFEQDLTSVFCSELVAFIYQKWRYIFGGTPNEFTPSDFQVIACADGIRHFKKIRNMKEVQL